MAQNLNRRKLCIVGAGGFGREVLSSFMEGFITAGLNIEKEVVFMDYSPTLKSKKVMDIPVIQTVEFDPDTYDVVVAVGNPKTRSNIVAELPNNTCYTTLIHPTAIVMAGSIIGEGSIITAGTIVTCNIRIGKHCHLNLNTTVGHDCIIGDYFTTAPGAHISGECKFGHRIYFGTNSAVRQGINICDDVTIGMGGVVVKDITESGVYIGSPVRKMEKNK